MIEAKSRHVLTPALPPAQIHRHDPAHRAGLLLGPAGDGAGAIGADQHQWLDRRAVLCRCGARLGAAGDAVDQLDGEAG